MNHNPAPMKLTIPKVDLVAALKQCKFTTDRKSTMPILGHVKLTVHNAGLTLATTDLEGSTVTDTAGAVDKVGVACLPLLALQKAVTSLKGAGDIQLESAELPTNQHCVRLTAGKSTRTVVGVDVGDFPAVPSPGDDAEWNTLSAKTLKDLLAYTAYAVSDDETRYNLNGLLFEARDNGKTLRCVATDGHRLALSDAAVDGVSFGEYGKQSYGERGIVPKQVLKALGAMLKSPNGQVRFVVEGGIAFFEYDPGAFGRGVTTIAARLIEGQFPDYAQIIPVGPKAWTVVDRPALIDALKQVRHFIRASLESVVLNMQAETMTLTGKAEDLGEASETLSAARNGPPLEVALNVNYLLQALEAFPGDAKRDVVRLEGGDAIGLIVITNGSGDRETLALVMTMRV